MISFFALLCGLTTLTLGAQRMIKGGSWLASKRGVSEVVLGLTLVTLGTTAPEFVVNISAVLNGTPDIAIWNIVWSNIVNILLILSLAATIRPLVLKGTLSNTDVLFCLAAPLLLWLVSADNVLSSSHLGFIARNDGIILLLCFVGFLYHLYSSGQHEVDDDTIPTGSTYILVLFCVIWIIWLIGGAKLTLWGAEALARTWWLSERIIWLTIIAIGTSLPELVTMLVAVSKNHGNLAVGNLLWSCVFNVFRTLGISSIIYPLPVSSLELRDMLVSILAMGLLTYTFFFTREKTIQRRQGAAGVLLYIGYMVYTFLRN